jgi:benzodiazapine receptor
MKVNWFLLVGLVVICNLIGSLGAIWTSSDGEWYKKINKPSFNPPNWVFAPVWTLLFSMMGVALYFVWVSSNSNIRTVALILFVVQFILNVLWSYLFFGVNNLSWSLIEISILLISILSTGICFYFVNRISGVLMVPYFFWVGFASVLNYFLWKLNN